MLTLHCGKTMKCVKRIKQESVFELCSLHVATCAIKSQLPLINTVELIVFPALNDFEC